MSQTQHAETLIGAAAKLSPPASVVAASSAGMALPDWVLVASLVYTCLMIAKLLWDWFGKPYFERRKK